jgi:hypothetical protein
VSEPTGGHFTTREIQVPAVVELHEGHTGVVVVKIRRGGICLDVAQFSEGRLHLWKMRPEVAAELGVELDDGGFIRVTK